MLGEPGSDARALVGLVVVENQTQVELGRELAIEGAQELEELLLAVAPPPWQRLRPLQRLRRTRAKCGSSQRIPEAVGACRRGFDSGPDRSYDNDPARLSTLPPRVPDSGPVSYTH